MDIVIMVSDILTILAIVNIILLAVFIFSGHYPVWLFIWQGVFGILIAVVLTVVSRRYRKG
jgi:hypothetical protein